MTEDQEEYVAVVPPQSSNGHSAKPITRLSALDRVFEARGTVDVKAGERTITLPIQSVDNAAVEGVLKPYKPLPPTRSQLEGGRRVIIENQADPAYQEKLAEFNRLSSYVYIFMALALDVEDAQGKVVWSADNTVHDVEGTKRALQQAGIVDNQMAAILTAAANLTREVEQQQVLD
jgi:hypothetical protein